MGEIFGSFVDVFYYFADETLTFSFFGGDFLGYSTLFFVYSEDFLITLDGLDLI
jgi:hypothetical protein